MQAAEAPGAGVGPYRLERCLGRGATGQVWLARHAASGQRVALKLLSGVQPLQAAARARFSHEAQSIRRLAHPGIVALLDEGEDRGQRYLAMEFIDGPDLSAHTAPARWLPPPEVLGLGAQAAEALAHAHRHGVVHRDVKPANLIHHAASGTLKLADFGVARLAMQGGAAAQATRSGLLLGTVAYMPPELLAGQPAEPSSDLYALGATLYHLLSGHLPHEAATLAQQMRAIAQRPAPDIRAFRPELGEPVAAELQQLLSKAPAARGTDGDALAARLRALASG